MKFVLDSPFFGVALSVFAYKIGLLAARKAPSPVTNPLLIAILLVIAFLRVFDVPLSDYDKGGSLLTLMLSPATALLAVSVYNRRELLWKNLLPIAAGCFVGAATSWFSTLLLCRFFRLNPTLTASLMPKSVTTPIAMELSSHRGGIVSLTVAAVIFTGILGAVFAPLLIKALKITNPVAAGVAIGTSSHGIGTARALELGETEGAMSGIAIGVTGIATVLLAIIS
ncbi:MAG: LrgB family protein [Synergistaceae bacterium]|jgi:predicted murein hydrolase (TIGR00659 family)|nr:LrgB family protein [Synergistaceae bacterium]